MFPFCARPGHYAGHLSGGFLQAVANAPEGWPGSHEAADRLPAEFAEAAPVRDNRDGTSGGRFARRKPIVFILVEGEISESRSLLVG